MPQKEFSSTEELYHYKPHKRAGLRLSVIILAVASPMLAGYLITRTLPSPQRMLAVDKAGLPALVSILIVLGNLFVTHWYLFVGILVVVFFLLEIFVKARWKVYLFYFLVSAVVWAGYLVYTKNLVLPQGVLDKVIGK